MIEVSDRLSFCLNCFRQIDREATRCPFCGVEADCWRQIDYVARLSHALGHPLDDVRMRAIIALGRFAKPQTEDALVDCAVAHSTDVTNGLEIVRSLRAIADRHGCRSGLLRLSADHPARWMRRAAEDTLASLPPSEATTVRTTAVHTKPGPQHGPRRGLATERLDARAFDGRGAESDDMLRRVGALRQLHDGEKAFMDVVACGPKAIPALRELLFEREPSGLYQPRCLAADALAALGAKEVLLDFLDRSPREIEDAVERTGEEAVINAAARALAGWPDDRVFATLLRLAKDRPSLAGVIEALGDFRRPETLPALIMALSEDFSRDAAEKAIGKLGLEARPALVRASTLRLASEAYESETSLRRRRSALRLLADIGVPRTIWRRLKPLLDDRDIRIASLACKICLYVGERTDKQVAARRLIKLLVSADPMSTGEIEDLLVEHFEVAQSIVDQALGGDHGALSSEATASALQLRCLRRIKARAEIILPEH